MQFKAPQGFPKYEIHREIQEKGGRVGQKINKNCWEGMIDVIM